MATRVELIVITTLLIGAAVPAGWHYARAQQSPAARGATDARLDLAMGRYEIKMHGKPLPPSNSYWKSCDLLYKRYGVGVSWERDCVVTLEEVEYVRGYNDASKQGIIRHFGKDVFAECERDVQ